ncbi:hypothetical protein [Microbacterium sp. CJ77]|uniref:hypothetical protein n=1 Tax=Microbacterium sp. CJ77 TaxID=2079201 RepID=UPI000CD93740|nr:hypothetical protein [Microbacterium sp. CJ77]NLA10340.1 hypothetical protein [Microbacteriaceae bacterium]
MRSSRQGAIPSELGWLIDELDSTSERLRTLEAPSGESLGSTVAKLQALIANIQAQIDAWAATRWTNIEIQNAINSTVAAYVASYLAGNVTIGGSLNVLADAQVNGAIRAPGVRATDLTAVGSRIVVWQGGPADPRLGHT